MHARAYIVMVVFWLFAGGAATFGVVGAAAAGPAGSRMLPWRDEADIGPDAARLRRTLAELCVTELRDISFEGNLAGAVHTLGEAYRRARGRGLSLLIRAGEGRRFSGAGGPHVRMKHRSTTVARAMDDLCRQADLFWEVTPIGIVCFDAWNLEESRRRMAPGDLARYEAELVEAQKAGDEAGVWRHAEACAWAYAHRNGGTEEPGPFLEVSEGVAPLSAEEVRRGFDSHLQELKKRKWWAVGLDPTRTGRLPREVGIAIQGCVGAERARLPCWEEGLQFAREAADYIMWTQNFGGKGVVPFPLCRSGDAAFVSAGGFISRVASNTGASHNGWVVDDLGDGSLQVDNSHCGVALYELYEATKEPKFFDMACEAAGWAMVEPIAPNWVYNGMTVYLLGWAYDATGDNRYLESARRRLRLGILPGQVLRGPLAGRWADPRSSGAAEHFTFVLALAQWLSAIPRDDPDRAMCAGAMRAALKAWQAELTAGKLPDTDCVLDALVAVERVRLLQSDLADFDDCGVTEALGRYERVGAEALRAGRLAFGPSAWARLLELKARGPHLERPRFRVKRR